ADEKALAVRLTPHKDAVRLKVYHPGAPIALSDRVPMLENFGFRVIDERTYTVKPLHRAECFIHDMELEAGPGIELGDADQTLRIENAILAVWRNAAESDGLNQLTPGAGLSWYD